jgi:Zn-dependent protease with chaperone function
LPPDQQPRMTEDPFDLSSELPGSVIPAGDTKLRREATLTVGPEGVSATTEAGDVHLVPWKNIRLGREGAAVTVVAADRSLAIRSEHPDFMRALETAGGNDLNDALSRLAGERVSSPAKHRLSCLVILVILALITWAIPRMFRGAVDATVDVLPYSVDEAIGEAVWEQMDLGGPEVDDPLVRAAIRSILDRLQPFAEIPEAEFEFKVVEQDIANAFALPGGYFVVFTGLITRSDSPEQVAGVIAHEMAHVTRRHGLRRIAHSIGMWAGVSILFGSTDALTGAALDLFTLASVNSYSQDQETDADLEGARMLLAAGIDPQGLAQFFSLMKEEYGDVPDALAWTSTHPQHEDRIAAIEDYVDEFGDGRDYISLDLDWAAVKAALESPAPGQQE